MTWLQLYQLRRGLAVVESVYPEPFDPAENQSRWSPAAEAEVVLVEHIGRSGVVLAYGQAVLLALAELLKL